MSGKAERGRGRALPRPRGCLCRSCHFVFPERSPSDAPAMAHRRRAPRCWRGCSGNGPPRGGRGRTRWSRRSATRYCGRCRSSGRPTRKPDGLADAMSRGTPSIDFLLRAAGKLSGTSGVTNSEKTLSEIEKLRTRSARRSRRPKKLAERSQKLLDRHRREIEKKPKPEPGGWGGIRTHGELAPTAVFKTAALNHSATHPARRHSARGDPRVQAKRPAEFHRGRKLVPYRRDGEAKRVDDMRFCSDAGRSLLRRLVPRRSMRARPARSIAQSRCRRRPRQRAGFRAYLPQLRAQAEAAGVSRRDARPGVADPDLQPAHGRARPGPAGRRRRRRPPIPPFAPYRARHVTPALISRGRSRYAANHVAARRDRPALRRAALGADGDLGPRDQLRQRSPAISICSTRSPASLMRAAAASCSPRSSSPRCA